MPNPSKPPHLKSIAGTARPDRPDPDANAPQYDIVTEFPEPPQHLTVDGATMWKELGRQLVANGVLQTVDLYALEQLCFAWQRFRKKCRADLEFTASEDNALTAQWAQFGLTPATRRRIIANVVDPGAQSSKNRFAGHGRKPGGPDTPKKPG